MSSMFRPRVESLEGRLLLAGVESSHDEHVEAPIAAPDVSSVELPTVSVTVERQSTCDVLVVCVLSNQATQHVSVDGGEGEWTDFNGVVRLQVPFDTLAVALQITNLQGETLPELRIVFDAEGNVVSQSWGDAASDSVGSGIRFAPLNPATFEHGHEATTGAGVVGAAAAHDSHASRAAVALAHADDSSGAHAGWERRGSSLHAISRGPLELSPGLGDDRAGAHRAPSGATEGEAAAGGSSRTAEASVEEASDEVLASDWAGGSLEVGELESSGVIGVLAEQVAATRSESPFGEARGEPQPATMPAAPKTTPGANSTESGEDDELDPWSVAAIAAVAVASGTAALVVERRSAVDCNSRSADSRRST